MKSETIYRIKVAGWWPLVIVSFLFRFVVLSVAVVFYLIGICFQFVSDITGIALESIKPSLENDGNRAATLPKQEAKAD